MKLGTQSEFLKSPSEFRSKQYRVCEIKCVTECTVYCGTMMGLFRNSDLGPSPPFMLSTHLKTKCTLSFRVECSLDSNPGGLLLKKGSHKRTCPLAMHFWLKDSIAIGNILFLEGLPGKGAYIPDYTVH